MCLKGKTSFCLNLLYLEACANWNEMIFTTITHEFYLIYTYRIYISHNIINTFKKTLEKSILYNYNINRNINENGG